MQNLRTRSSVSLLLKGKESRLVKRKMMMMKKLIQEVKFNFEVQI